MSTVGKLLSFGIDISAPGGSIDFLKSANFQQGSLEKLGTGKVFWVDSGDGSATGSGKSPAEALSTIDAAIGKCEANRGDIIYVAQGHAENIADATSLVCDIAGVTIIGLGAGSLRPKLSHTAAAGVIQVSAANVTFKNIVFEAAFADVTEVFNLTTAKYFTCVDCDFQDSAANMNFLWIVDTNTTNNAADGLAFVRCRWITPDTATQSWCDIDADLDQLTFIGCYANLGVNTSDVPVLAAVAAAKDVTNVLIKDNVIIRLNDANPLLITVATTTANTGAIVGNLCAHRDTAASLLVTAGTNILFAENYTTEAIDESAYLNPAVGTL